MAAFLNMSVDNPQRKESEMFRKELMELINHSEMHEKEVGSQNNDKGSFNQDDYNIGGLSESSVSSVSCDVIMRIIQYQEEVNKFEMSHKLIKEFQNCKDQD